MKVLIANTSYPPNKVGGAERVVQTLAEALVTLGHQVTVSTLQPRGKGRVAEMNGVRVRYTPAVNIYRQFGETKSPGAVRKALWHGIDSYNPAMARVFGRILDEERPDVVNTHNLVGFSVSAMSAVKDRALPLVHTLHDQYLLCPSSTMFKGSRNCESRCAACGVLAFPRRAVSQSVDVVIGVSRFILEHHFRFGYFRSAEHRIVHNGVLDGAGREERVRTRDGVFRFGFLGQILATKGLHRLIEAFAAECGTQAELWIAGKGEEGYEAELRARTADMPNVRWLGFIKPDVLLDAVDVLAVPSIWRDTAPLVVLEAYKHGVPVLGADRGGIPEFITPETGWLFDVDNPAQMRRALRVCLSSRERLAAMGAAARLAVKNFTVKRFVDGYLDAFSAAAIRAGSAASPYDARS